MGRSKTMSVENKRKRLILAGVAVAVLALAAGGVIWRVYAGGPDLEKDLTSGKVDQMSAALVRAKSEDLRGAEASELRRQTIETMKNMSVDDIMAMLRSDKLSDEDRRRLMENLRTLWMQHMAEMADEYFVASAENKVKLLDKQIDDFTEFMQKMRDYREKHKDDPEFQQQESRDRERWGRRDTADAKQQMVETSPDQQAKMFYVFGEMRKRAQERGIEMGWGGGPRGGRGGPGGPGARRGPGGEGRPGGSDQAPTPPPRERQREE